MNQLKIYGTTVFIGNTEIETRYGHFKLYTYQDLIHKGYILALIYGDIKSELLYTRAHSSCVTSETFRSIDCDCVQQLNGALEIIVQKKNGILFYLIQEGRGCGYVGKARNRMLTQYTDEELSTFDAYEQLGMKHDYRTYTNVTDICKMLNINSKFVLLTNNDDKITGLEKAGMNIERVKSIEVKPNPFNQSYLISKQQSGHHLYLIKCKLDGKYKIPKEKIIPFEPYHLNNIRRFIHVSTYYLPIKPVDNKILLNNEDLNNLLSLESSIEYIKLTNGLNYVYCDDDMVKKYTVLQKPYWFKVYVYWDIASNSDYVVLEYGDSLNSDVTPIVRIRSESILNRFPLTDRKYKDFYKKSIEMIIKNGCGLIILFHHDGRGSGFGNYILNQIHDMGVAGSKTGVKKDVRDYKAAGHLIKHHTNGSIQLLYTEEGAIENIKKELRNVDINLEKLIFIGSGNSELGHEIIYNRINKTFDYIDDFRKMSRRNDFINCLSNNLYVTGIGSSMAHAKYLKYLLTKYTNKNVEYIPFIHFYNENFKIDTDRELIIFSQGLSSNINKCFERYQYKNIILFTSVTQNNQTLNKLKENNCPVIYFPEEDEYTTLIRTIGPLCGFLITYNLVCTISSNDNHVLFKLKNDVIYTPSEQYIDNVINNKSVLVITSSPLIDFSDNIILKLTDGVFFKARTCNYLDFVHGYYQNLSYNSADTSVIILKSSESDNRFVEKIQKMISKSHLWILDSDLSEDLKIIEYEIALNYFILRIMSKLNINQIDWPNKNKETSLYEIKS